jgi:hypothetical protein
MLPGSANVALTPPNGFAEEPSEQVLFNDQDATSPSACQMERRTDTHDAATDDRYRGVRGQRLWWAGQFRRVMSAIKHSRPRVRPGADGNLFQRG